MWMHRQDDGFMVLDMATEPFDLIGIDIWRCHFNGGRQVDNDFISRRRLPNGIDGIDDLDSELQLRASEAFWRILQDPLSLGTLCRQLLDQRRAAHRDIDDASAIKTE